MPLARGSLISFMPCSGPSTKAPGPKGSHFTPSPSEPDDRHGTDVPGRVTGGGIQDVMIRLTFILERALVVPGKS